MLMSDNIVVILIVAVIVGLAVGYIFKEKKAGNHCIGCPHSKCCSAARNGGCSSCQTKE